MVIQNGHDHELRKFYCKIDGVPDK